MKYDVIIIGAGLSGLTAGIQLVKSGKKVCLLEKHKIPGGYATNFTRKGFNEKFYTFDSSIHTISGFNKNCSVYKTLDNLGILKNTEILENKQYTTIIKNSKETIDIPNNFEEFKIMLIKNFPNFSSNINSLFEFIKNLYEDMKDLILKSDAPKYQTELESISLYDFLKKYVDDENFIEIFSYLCSYLGLPPKDLNAFYYMVAISSFLLGGSYYIKGGSGHITKIMKNELEKHNANIHLSSEVIEIHSQNDKIISVTTKNKEVFEAYEFIFACDPNHIFSLIKNNTIINDYVNKLKFLEKSISASQLYIALDCSTKEVDINTSHLFINNLSHQDSYANIKAGNFENSNFELTAYDQMDCDLNKNGSFLCVSSADFITNWPERNTEMYKQKKEQISQLFLEKVLKFFPKIKQHIQVLEFATPRTMQRYTNNTNGSILGWAQNIQQGGFNRPSFKTPFSNAITIGAWSYPGGGFEGVISSSILGVNRILSKKENSNNIKNEILPLNVIMDGMVAKFNPANAVDKHIIYKFIFDGYNPIYLEIKDNTAKLLPAEPSHVDTTITTTHETWYKIAFNELSGQDALMDGLVSCSGNLRNFASMPKIFDKEIPDNFSSNETNNSSNEPNTSNSNDNNVSENNTKEIENTFTKELMPIKAIMNGMLAGFDSSKAEGLDIRYKFSFDNQKPVYLEIKNNTAKLLSREPSKIDTTIITTHETWHRIAFEGLDGEDALMDGLIKCEGNLKNFALMPTLFNTSEEEDNSTSPNLKLNPVIWVSLALVPWIFYWITHNIFSPSIVSAFSILYTTFFINFIKPKNFRIITKLESTNLAAFSIYNLASFLNPVLFKNIISPFFLDIVLILTLFISAGTNSSVMSEYSKISFHPSVTKTKLFKIINRNLTLLWALVFAIRFILMLVIPSPLNNLSYLVIMLGIIISYFYPKSKLGH